ncbi:MAG: gamma-glutamylcyclotransferase [Armatimonadetes bacterium]|nr:gamma-glutamylcyclotransferase [Armatimonadota bacterium]
MATLFCYGSLKRGFWNHEIYCADAISIQHATVRGRLYEFSSGIPVLEVPDTDILAYGTGDILEDIALQRRFEMNRQKYLECNGDGWKQIEGELITLPDPAITIPPIDRLEGFHPDSDSLYLRVLVPVKLTDERVTTAWCYVAAPETARTLTLTISATSKYALHQICHKD